MSGRLPRLPGVVATVDTAGEGYFFTPVPSGTNVAGLLPSVDGVVATQFVLPFRLKVGKLTVKVTTGDATKKIGAAIYDVNKNLLLESGALDAASAAVVSGSLATSVTLEPGVYWIATTSDSTSVVYFSTRQANDGWTAMLSENGNKTGISNQTAPAPGTFPSSLGTMDGSARNVANTLLEP